MWKAFEPEKGDGQAFEAGISSAHKASAGHVAQSGIESTPTQVHARGESGRRSRAGGPSDSHKIAALMVMNVASLGGARTKSRADSS
jgi:hypothetical protein